MTEIDTESVFKQIKKQNGEAVAKVLRSEILLDTPNLVHILEFAGNDPEKIKALAPVIREIYKNKNTPEYKTDKNPLELLYEAGYDAFVVKTEEQKNSIKKYYRPNEELCTFRDPERHKKYFIIHAIKRDVNKIKPSRHPEREDEYGTSVISIQIAKGGGFISIKNRYNHTVNNPDATFNNNPDNIIPGLSDSLKKYFNVDFNVSKAPIPANFHMVHDQFVYFNYELNNVCFGSDYYFSGSTITKLNTDYEIMLDYYVLNTKTGEVRNVSGVDYSTHSILQDMFQNKKITVQINPNNKHERMIYANGEHVLSVEKGTITELNLPNIKNIGNSFMIFNQNLRKIYAPKLETVGYNFLSSNKKLTELDLPSLKTVEDCFMMTNECLEKFNAPRLERTKSSFLSNNLCLKELDLPAVKQLGDNNLKNNTILEKLHMPKVEIIGPIFLLQNTELKYLDLPHVREIGGGFLRDNKVLQTFYAPELEKIEDHVLSLNLGLTELSLPSLIEIGDNFLRENKKLKTFYAPKLQTVKWHILSHNTELTNLYVANDDILREYNKRLILVLAKNKMKQKMRNRINRMINTVNHSDNDKS